MRKLLYAKLYPNKYALINNAEESKVIKETSIDKDDDFFEQLFNESEYIPIPERIEESKRFVDLAIYYSNESETAVEITQGNDRIFVTFFFDFLANFGDLKDTLAELIHLSDSIDIYQPKDNEKKIINLLLGFKTHEHYVAGNKMA